MNWAIVEVTQPAVEPVSLAELRAHLRLDPVEGPHPDDDLVEAQGIAAREWVEAYIGYVTVQRQLRLYLDEFPSEGVITLPRSRLLSIDSVQYYDAGGNIQTWDETNYTADTASVEGRLLRNPGIEWPAIQSRKQAVMITYMAGYLEDGDDLAANVPKAIKSAIKLMVSNMYEYREEMIAGTVTAEIKGTTTVKDLLAPYKRHYL